METNISQDAHLLSTKTLKKILKLAKSNGQHVKCVQILDELKKRKLIPGKKSKEGNRNGES